MAEITERHLAYFAGFFDGEGCVGMYTRRYVVSLTNTDIRPILLAKELWGGTVYCQKKEGRRYARQDLWIWHIYGHKSKPFLEAIRPFTIIKKDQIDCYLSTMKHVPRFRGERYKEGAAVIINDATVRLKLLKRGGQ